MKQLVSSHLREIAGFFVFASGLDLNKLQDIMEKLKKIVENKEFFIENEKEHHYLDPLTFSKEGLKEIRKLEIPIPSGLTTFRDLISRIDDAIMLAAKGGDEGISRLNNYIERALRHPGSGRWVHTYFNGLSYEDAKHRAIERVINPIVIAMSSALKFPKEEEIELRVCS